MSEVCDQRYENPENAPLLEARRLCKAYPDGWTLHDVSFHIEQGRRLCLLGPSGCGKTTLLRLIAGLESPDSGQVFIEGNDVTTTPPHLRGVGLMFQEYALFPHKDVFGNVAFGLRMAGMRRTEINTRVREVLEWVGLTGFEQRDVGQLSGGERQRVALARSLAPHPRLLMLDEPLGALDRTLRERLMADLPRILRRAGVTTIVVTHDQEEAFSLADRVVLMHAGRVEQIGTPEEVYSRPVSVWAARFLGLTNLLPGCWLADGQVETDLGRLSVAESARAGTECRPPTTDVWLLIRPEAAQFDIRNDANDVNDTAANVVRGVVAERVFRGERYRLLIRHPSGIEMTFHIPAQAGRRLPPVGESVTFSLSPRALMVLPVVE